MNIAPVIEKVMDSLNCSDNCDVVNVERVIEEKEDEDEEKAKEKAKEKDKYTDSKNNTKDSAKYSIISKEVEYVPGLRSIIEEIFNIFQD